MSSAQPGKKTRTSLWDRFINSSAGPWFQKTIALLLFALVVNHLATPESFPGGKTYRFPIEGVLISIVLCILIGIIAYLNFNFYKIKYFSSKVDIANIAWFMASTVAYITIMYIPVNIIFNIALGGDTEFYYLLIGLLITLLLSIVLISLWYAPDIYQLHKTSLRDAEITIESGAKVMKLTNENIACFYIKNKIVYTVKHDGTKINTNFTLNELEDKINDQVFFRANRQMIIHKDAIGQIEKIENGKLRIRLKTTNEKDAIPEIIISRYKRKAFMNWIQ